MHRLAPCVASLWRLDACGWLALLLAVLLAFSAFSSGSAHALPGTQTDAAGWQDGFHAIAAAQSDDAVPCDRNSHGKTDSGCCMVGASCVLWALAAEPGLTVPPRIPSAFHVEAERLTSGRPGLQLRPPRLLARA